MIRPRINNIDKWSDDEFRRRFRLSKPVVLELLTHIECRLQHRTNRNNAIAPIEQLLITLRFFATGSFYIAVGDLTGDGGYPLRQYLITPLADPQTEAERLFNEAQIRTRNVIERTFGVWKRRFPVLSVGMRCKLHLVQQTIVATAVLHNIAVLNNDIEFSEEGPIDEQDVVLGDVNPVERNDVNNEQVRRDLIDYFGTLL
ncbi:hypothetical protein PPYR_01144 [Photinus pyralis]|uniref:DDE Tnp4 domain-containing protein n=1 Tax=Photinus pyralis TaxID=7054 RepID=A0A5N4B3P2_PHOPY|nr:hypothetical protein PPYR_01144 [Photinus pyralis]